MKMRELSCSKGFDFRVVLLPELHGLVDTPFAREHALITEFLNEADIPVLDLAPFFRGERRSARALGFVGRCAPERAGARPDREVHSHLSGGVRAMIADFLKKCRRHLITIESLYVVISLWLRFITGFPQSVPFEYEIH
jgi:hypothetical protein